LFEVPHRDFVSFSTRKISVIVSYEENGAEHFAIVPLLTITAANGARLRSALKEVNLPTEHAKETKGFGFPSSQKR
jgi:hypothetical protein